MTTQSVWGVQTILLKNGTSLKGDVTGQNEKAITVRAEDGSVKTFSKKSILKVIYKDVNEEEAKRIRQEEERKLQEAKTTDEQKKIEEQAVVPEPVKTGGARSRWGLVWRSAVLPGWGHWKAERKKTSIVYGSLFWGGVVFTAMSANQIQQKKSDYDQSTLLAQFGGNLVFGEWYVSEKRAAYKKAIQDYQTAATGTVLIYLIQLTHSYFTGVAWEQEETVLSPQGEILKRGLQLDSYREGTQTNSAASYSSSPFGWRAEARYNWFF
ncbi:hypothetical protein EHQ12_06925 [Leptospira gomenensis]|uniref:DUF5683 domain-containing protein n=1 Tax=Leptospira gomenensis TaxID=2484974 RepID=A0A5F1YGR2_9LEPT|nr:hypothetical protein EHQ17_02550 [Leptospira gomenensis]TGK40837.1 hypothetical protein EHQ12_06925 [Leptospira gomenensis]TGK43193.1 hypothetical protein EHQ07_12845 [Leptospira gomenensis]